jgi:membrane protein involved in colicin uptake
MEREKEHQRRLEMEAAKLKAAEEAAKAAEEAAKAAAEAAAKAAEEVQGMVTQSAAGVLNKGDGSGIEATNADGMEPQRKRPRRGGAQPSALCQIVPALAAEN